MEKTSEGLCEYALAQLGRPYWMGTFGEYASQALLDYERGRFPKYYTARDFEQQFGQKVHDCGGLVKGYMFCDTPNSAPKYNRKYDENPRMLWDSARVKGADMAKFPAIRGYLVYDNNLEHVGVYVGDGLVCEAKGHAYGVVTTSIKSSRWKKWSDYWAVSYGKEDDEVKYSQIREIKRGSVGEEVRVVQAVTKVVVDGIFGANTDKAVRTFQRQHGLVVDGIVGEKTWKAIIERWYNGR